MENEGEEHEFEMLVLTSKIVEEIRWSADKGT